MAGKWPAWEQALRAAELWVANIPPATRGLKWDEPVAIEGDWTGATLEGTVSASPDAGVDLAEFSFTGPVVAEIAGVTTSTWMASLAAGTGTDSTGVLPDDDDVDGVETFPCMFRLTPSGGDEATVFGGYFTVAGLA